MGIARLFQEVADFGIEVGSGLAAAGTGIGIMMGTGHIGDQILANHPINTPIGMIGAVGCVSVMAVSFLGAAVGMFGAPILMGAKHNADKECGRSLIKPAP